MNTPTQEQLEACAKKGAEAAHTSLMELHGERELSLTVAIFPGAGYFRAELPARLAFASAVIAEYERQREEESFESLHAEYLQWVRDTFPDETVADQIAHLKEEFVELAEDFAKGDEYADVLMLLLCVAAGNGVDVIREFRAKFAKNKGRKWEKTANGYRHVKPASTTPTPPPGHHLATEAERLKLPEGRKLWYFIEWINSSNEGPARCGTFYACPNLPEDKGDELVTRAEYIEHCISKSITEKINWINARHREKVAALQSRLAAVEKRAERAESGLKEAEDARTAYDEIGRRFEQEAKTLRTELAKFAWRGMDVKPTKEDADTRGWILVKTEKGAVLMRGWYWDHVGYAGWLPLSSALPPKPDPEVESRKEFDQAWTDGHIPNTADKFAAWAGWNAARATKGGE